MGRVEGKIAFVTGAARGQGRSHAVRLAQEGADIIALDLCDEIRGAPYPSATKQDLAETVRLVEELGRRIVAERADVRNYEQVKSVVDRGVAEFGRLDIVCANAAVGGSMMTAELFTEEMWTDMVDVTLNGVWRTVKASIPHIKAGGRGGSIILTSSGAGTMGIPHIGNYVAAKHGVIGLMRTMAKELAGDFIRANAICPGTVNTPMIQSDAMYKMFRPDLDNPTFEDFKEASMRTFWLPIPWLEPIDISNAVLFLASDEARYITGVTLPVDGGCMR